MGKPMGVLLLILGVLLGPAYYVYARFFSGTVLATQALAMNVSDGTVRAATTLELAPAQGPIGLILRVLAEQGPLAAPSEAPRDPFVARVLLHDRLILEHRFTLASSAVEPHPGLVFQEALPLLDALDAGTYRVELASEGAPQLTLRHVDVQVRSGMQAPDWRIVATGAALLTAGVAALVF